jgi:hypothetical protein
VGVAQPSSIDAKIMTITPTMGSVPGSDAKRSPQVKPRMDLPTLGLQMLQMTTMME